MDAIVEAVDISTFEKMEGVIAEEIEFLKSGIGQTKNEMLILSAEKGYLKVVQFLIENGANIHAYNDAVLICAKVGDRFNTSKLLIEFYVSNPKTDYALKMSAKNGHLEVVKYLVENGANINANFGCALHLSVVMGNLEVVKYLIENDSNIHIYNEFASRLAAENGHVELVKYLTENDANVSSDSLLGCAAENGHLELVKYLVENGANIHHLNDAALRESARNGRLEVVRYLVEKGANIHAMDDFASRDGAFNGHLEVVKYLVENGANIHADNNYALRCASKNSHFETVEFLLENGANISVLSDEEILNLISKNVVVNGTNSKTMQEAWDKLVQPVKDEKKKVLDQVITQAMSYLLNPDSIRVKILEHQFIHKDNREEYRYMD